MALSPTRIHQGAETSYVWERAAIDFVLGGLSDLDPFQAWPLQELSDVSSGRLYEIDLLLLGRRALYLIEIKSWPGRVSGDVRDWRVTHEGRDRFVENPYFLTNSKAKVLASKLKAKLEYPDNQIWVEPLVFLSHEGVDVQPLDESGKSHVVTRGNIIKALTHDDYPGSPATTRRRSVNRRQMASVVKALHELGIRPSQASRRIGEYTLGPLLREGPGYQEHSAAHATLADRSRRVRSYLVPGATVAERRQQLERAARREAEVLENLGEHPSVLSCRSYVENAPLGPALLFEPFDDGLPLDMVIRLRPDLSFDDRMAILQRISEALAFCHGRGVLHRNLSPTSILVRKQDGQPIEVKLHSFHLASQAEGTRGTIHMTAMSDDVDLIYRAPEILDDPAGARVESDIFSLGALACLVLTGRHPAETIMKRDQALIRDKCIRLTDLSDDFLANFGKVIEYATAYNFAERPDDPMEWFSLLEEEATNPAPVAESEDVDPHKAANGQELPGGFVVQRILGSGTTARVFHVVKEKKHFALKVPHDDECAERLRAEHAVLAKLRHQHIVEQHGMHEVGSRPCLLLDLAAPKLWRSHQDTSEPRTLAELIRQQGPVGLDYAKRFGDDLLSAVQYLEEQSVQHRDIKPGNIGFTPSQKQARHLVLFDFSLAPAEPNHIMVGTPGYRDPGLRLRGRWDAAADRFSAAVTLYEMLVGIRLELAQGAAGQRANDPLIRAERFDAAVRDRLVEFFSRALHPDAERRFVSAEEMRHEWLGALTARFTQPLPTEVSVTDASVPAATIADESKHTTTASVPSAPTDPLANVEPSTPIDALPLTAAAKNGLDRAGIATAAELGALPRNHLSAIHGIGRRVAREIQAVAEEIRQRIGAIDKADAFSANYRGMRQELHAGPPLGLDPKQITRLRDAGIHNTDELASAARDRIHRLLGDDNAKALEKALHAQGEVDRPRSLTDWLTILLPKTPKKLSKTEKAVRTILGLLPLDGFAPGEAVAAGEVVRHIKIAQPNISVRFRALRKQWNQTIQIGQLVDLCQDIVQNAGGVCRFDQASDVLMAAHRRRDVDLSEAEVMLGRRHAGALLRAVAEMRSDGDGSPPLHLRKIRGNFYLALNSELIDAARQLGAEADRLAERNPLASTAEVKEALRRAVAHTTLAQLSHDRVVKLAADTSAKACASSRLELYPRSMSADRALDLSAAILGASGDGIEPEELKSRVRARYPEAAPLPTRPELDALLKAHGLIFDRTVSRYCRPDEQPATSVVSGTRIFLSMHSIAGAKAPLLDTPAANEARAFHDSIMTAVKRGRFRALQVRLDLADQAALRLAEELNVEPKSLDALFRKHFDALRTQMEVAEENIIQADREGPDGENWELLLKLVGRAADSMVEEILTNRESPQILASPGLLARYDLQAPLQSLVQRAEDSEGSAILLLVPSYETDKLPQINGTLSVPVPLAGQRLKIPQSWLQNAHRAAAPGLTL